MTTTGAPAPLAALLEVDIPPQRAFSYNRERWLSWLGHLDGVAPELEALPDATDRGAVASRVEGLLFRNTAAAFVVAMAWGHGTSGYGPYRTAAILTATRQPLQHPLDPSVVSRLEEAARLARVDVVDGYRYLNNAPGKIGGLGAAFFTKWLYFATARGEASNAMAAPILDAVVLRWLRTEVGEVIRPSTTRGYGHYLELLDQWGSPHGLTRVQVEERIFRLVRADGARPGADGGAIVPDVGASIVAGGSSDE